MLKLEDQRVPRKKENLIIKGHGFKESSGIQSRRF